MLAHPLKFFVQVRPFLKSTVMVVAVPFGTRRIMRSSFIWIWLRVSLVYAKEARLLKGVSLRRILWEKSACVSCSFMVLTLRKEQFLAVNAYLYSLCHRLKVIVELCKRLFCLLWSLLHQEGCIWLNIVSCDVKRTFGSRWYLDDEERFGAFNEVTSFVEHYAVKVESGCLIDDSTSHIAWGSWLRVCTCDDFFLTDSGYVISAIESHITDIVDLSVVAWAMAWRNVVCGNTSSISISFIVTKHVVLACLDEPGGAFGILRTGQVHLELAVHIWNLLCVVVIEVVV